MPIYDYNCPNCGSFRRMRPMAESGRPTACPACGQLSRKVIAAPFLADMASHNRIASQRNEKSADAPRVMSRGEMDLRDGHIGHSHSATDAHGNVQWVQSRHPNMIGH